jgi:hypothetical protein
MSRYIFPTYCRIEEVKDAKAEVLLKKENIQSRYLIFNMKTKGIFFINESIKNFLSLFQTPKSKEEIIQEIIQEGDPDKLLKEKQVIDFIKSMIKRGFLTTIHDNLKKPDPILQSFNDFQILDVLKESEYEAVYKAKNIKTSTIVVLKALLPSTETDQQKAKRVKCFEQEFSIMREGCHHSNICSLIHFDECKNVATLEFCEGQTLKHLIEEHQIPALHKFNVFREIAKAISFLHQHEIIHGDIHAKQFIINSSYGVKLVDFGFSFRVNSIKTQTIRRGGIYNYLEPENITPDAFTNVIDYVPTFQSEVYRLGILLYFILYEKYPFESISWKNLCKSIKVEEPKFFNTLPCGHLIPNCYLDILKLSLNKVPEKRFVSAIEILNLLMKYDN